MRKTRLDVVTAIIAIGILGGSGSATAATGTALGANTAAIQVTQNSKTVVKPFAKPASCVQGNFFAANISRRSNPRFHLDGARTVVSEQDGRVHEVQPDNLVLMGPLCDHRWRRRYVEFAGIQDWQSQRDRIDL